MHGSLIPGHKSPCTGALSRPQRKHDEWPRPIEVESWAGGTLDSLDVVQAKALEMDEGHGTEGTWGT